MIKALQKMGTEENYLKRVKAISPQQTLFSMAKTKSIPPKIRNKTRVSPFPTVIHRSCGSLSYGNREEKQIK